MDYIIQEILSDEIIPILLGNSPEATETAHRMYRKYGVVSHVFCSKVPLAARMSLRMKFHTVPHTSDERLLLDALMDFAAQIGNADRILYLIPCTEAYAKIIWNERNALERHFVIADKQEMERVWFGENASD